MEDKLDQTPSIVDIKYAIHHVFLPPRLPQSNDDSDNAASDDLLLKLVRVALLQFKTLVNDDTKEAVEAAAHAISSLGALRDGGFVDEGSLQSVLTNILHYGGFLPIHVKAQNAGMMISRQHESLLFEQFELSPRSEAAMSLQGRLRRQFPASSVSLPIKTLEQPGFITTFANTLAIMSRQEVAEMKPLARKAGQMHIEERDTTSPDLVTDFLATFLSAMGEVQNPSGIYKNTREEILWKDAKLPWRRSPVWLLVRVTIQLIFSRLLPKSNAYKHFVVYLMAYILKIAQPFDLSSDVLHCMTAKISRRLLKLDGDLQYLWLQKIEGIVSITRSCIRKRWEGIGKRSCPPLDMQSLRSIDFADGLWASYPGLDEFIDQIKSRRSTSAEVRFNPPWSLVAFHGTEIPSIAHPQFEEGSFFEFLEFETWVERSLDSWLSTNIDDPETCDILYRTVKTYHSAASSHYSGNPERLSVMILTVMELWIACDKSACSHHLLLHQYSPQVRFELLHSLILPFKSQADRLARVEAYAISRHTGANAQNPSIFSSFGEPRSFSVQFFQSSQLHQDLLERIEEEANERREQKKTQFRRLQAQHQHLMELIGRTEHVWVTIVNKRTGYPRVVHDKWCTKCQYQKTADNMTIDVHEWPLPVDELQAESVVFELKVPQPFNDWRNATAYLLNDVLRASFVGHDKWDTKWDLKRALPEHYCRELGRRIEVISTTKSHRGTHRKGKALKTATESDVLVNNGLTYRYYDYDNVKPCIVSELRYTDEVPTMCTYQLSRQSTALQTFLYRPHSQSNGPTANSIISEQSDCPHQLSLEEFKAMATLPVGNRIQWSNLLTQLYSPTMDLRKFDSTLILLQISRQAGPPAGKSACRDSHWQLEDQEFVYKFLDGLTLVFNKIKENWEACHALGAIISLTTRILSMSPSAKASSQCLDVLAECREVALNWIHTLQDKVKLAENDDARLEYRIRAFEVAHICIGSFEIDDDHLKALLSNSTQASTLLEASVVIQTGMQAALKADSTFHRLSTQRWKCLMHRCNPIFFQEIVEKKSPCLDHAIHKSWLAFPGVECWEPVFSTTGHWLESRTTFCPDARYSADSSSSSASRSSLVSLQIHFNLLTSELLVNGLPLSRLPSQYESSPQYRMLFGRTVIEVMPTNIAGMHFSSTKAHYGYTLHFGRSGTQQQQLLVVASQNDSTLDLIPPSAFSERLPDHFIHDYTHWYSRDSGTIEFRPKDNVWTPSPQNWTMRKIQSLWILEREGQSLVSPKSAMATQLLKPFEPIEVKEHSHIFFNVGFAGIEIQLPRIQLGFSLQSGSDRIYSNQFRGMYVDSAQSIGTLVGLHSKLVLKNQQGHRKVLVTNGEVSCARLQGHVKVVVNASTSNRAHAYDVDILLGRLIDDGSWQSKLTLCYLHALTSYCIPDPLTGKTGTEEALTMLQSAAMFSFDYLSKENLDILSAIAKLSPGRQYYPANERCMERVSWKESLSFLSQHGGFYTAVQSIFAHASATKFLYPDSYTEPPELSHVNDFLGKRQANRDSAFYVSGFSAEQRTSAADEIYKPRDQLLWRDRSKRVFEATAMIFEERQTLFRELGSKFVDKLWNLFSNDHEMTRGPKVELEIELNYDARWLIDIGTILRKYWCHLHRVLGKCPRLPKFQRMIWLATLAYSTNGDPEIIQVLTALANIPPLDQVAVPDVLEFRIVEGRTAERFLIESMVRKHVVPFADFEGSQHSQDDEEEKDYEVALQQHEVFENNQRKTVDKFVGLILKQWPSKVPSLPQGDSDFEKYIETRCAMEVVKEKWKLWYENHLFHGCLKSIDSTLRKCDVMAISPPEAENGQGQYEVQMTGRRFISEQALFHPHSPLLSQIGDIGDELLSLCPSGNTQDDKIYRLIDRLEEKAVRDHELNYVQELKRSANSLKSWIPCYTVAKKGENLEHYLTEMRDRRRLHVEDIYSLLKKTVDLNRQTLALGSAQCQRSSVQELFSITAPRVSPTFFLRQLARDNWQNLSGQWKSAIVAYGIAITKLQQAKRLIGLRSDEAAFLKELLNPGHSNWNPIDHPECLLLEVESDIMIREVQENIASQMRMPGNNTNAIMQLNMGEGKSTVIVPITAAELADGEKLVRVVCAKPQMKELHRMLVSKVGGLLNHRIYHMPFSRSLKLTSLDASAVYSLYRECMEKGGILLVQPEHILSFKLMGVEQKATGRAVTGDILLRIQHFFNSYSRDIVDESDENFSTKFELIYTMGNQRPVELSPERWTLIQRVLGMCARIAPEVHQKLPDSIEVTHQSKGRFPRTRFLRDDAQDLLLRELARKICDEGLPGLPIGRQSQTIRQSVLGYISQVDISREQADSVELDTSFFTESIKYPLLLLRGLIAEGVLGFVLGQKRWRVNYGLTSKRQPCTKLAVPYRAKDSPTPRSEFSHPDVVIALTCLCYYYEGLSDDDLFLAFGHLTNSDQADLEYQEWVKDAENLPLAFQALTGINMKDRYQAIHQIFPHLRFAKAVVDYFLTHIVFPKEMKEFPQKLSTSGWDIGEAKAHPTTGFSGTIDSRELLPLDVKYLDLEEQRHTNALVLDYLLQPENTVDHMSRPKNSQQSDAEMLLDLVTSMSQPIQVILDVGAQILELTNIQIAEIWLKKEQCKEAVVFFNDNDELCVIDRNGNVEALQTSPYSKQLGACLVFLDEAHTRGTDLKLPKDYRGAVTLGANLTKDRLVQACMRMRQLGKGQSVVFCIPEEIRTKICAASGTKSDLISVSDVLIWSISETYADLRRCMPLWAMQGVRHQRHAKIWAEATSPDSIEMSQKQAERFLEDEAQTLEYRYKPVTSTQGQTFLPTGQGTTNSHLDAIGKRCKEYSSSKLRSSVLQEEQERELSPEIEQERQVERPPPAKPEKHVLHDDVVAFVQSGIIPAESNAFVPAFESLANTTAANSLNTEELPDAVLCTRDFARTVKLTANDACSDSYQRPIQWILTSTAGSDTVQTAVIISPHEAQELMPTMKTSNSTHLHLYAPQLNPAFSALDDLKLYTVPRLAADWQLPRHLRLQLNLFAGQLYFRSFRDYKETCEMLSLAWEPRDDQEADGFVRGKASGIGGGKLSRSPVRFLKVLFMRIRRDCDEIDRTHWGRIFGGELLGQADF